MPRSVRITAQITAGLVATATFAAAAPVAAGGAVEVVRVTDRMGSPTYQVRGATGATLRCTAMDAAGVTLATAVPDRATGVVMFPQVKGDAVDRVACAEQ